jgi:hypothetical protein
MKYLPALLLFGLLLALAVFTLKALKIPKSGLDRWTNIAQVLGVGLAAFVILLKFFDGWGSTNMSMSLKTERQPYDDRQEILSVDIALERGDYGGIQLYGGEVRALDVKTGEPVAPAVPISGTDRIDYHGQGPTKWSEVSHDFKYRITPNEKMQLGAAILVPKGRPYLVQAVIHGYPDLWLPGRGFSQWRASTVSLLAEDKGKAESKP